MDLPDVVRARRMVRTYDHERPVPVEAVTALLDLAIRAPSAGFTQGWDFLVLRGEDERAAFWRLTTDHGDPDSWLNGMQTAPVLVLCLSDPQRYLDRYAEPDKGWADRDETRWPAPYWHIDTGMASLLILQTAVDEGLGACFFGIPPDRIEAFRQEFGIPADHSPIGAITIGHRTDDPGSAGSAAQRPRRTPDEVVHHGHWGG